MKPLTMILAACAMATAACGSAATMPEPNDPSTKIAVGDKPIASPAAELEQTAAAVEVDTRTASK